MLAVFLYLRQNNFSIEDTDKDRYVELCTKYYKLVLEDDRW